jgi:hypothetical protein
MADAGAGHLTLRGRDDAFLVPLGRRMPLRRHRLERPLAVDDLAH